MEVTFQKVNDAGLDFEELVFLVLVIILVLVIVKRILDEMVIT